MSRPGQRRQTSGIIADGKVCTKANLKSTKMCILEPNLNFSLGFFFIKESVDVWKRRVKGRIIIVGTFWKMLRDLYCRKWFLFWTQFIMRSPHWTPNSVCSHFIFLTAGTSGTRHHSLLRKPFFILLKITQTAKSSLFTGKYHYSLARTIH